MLFVLNADGVPSVARWVRLGGTAPPPPPNQAPTAAFTVAPAAPQTGQQATFTDTSTDTDGTIAARAWDLDNDGAFDDGTGASAARSFPAAGTYTVRLQVTDDDGAPATTSGQVTVADAPPPPPPPPPGNLVANPSFETSTVGWSGFQGTLLREAQAGAPNGGYVARVTRSSGTYFTIDGGNNVSPTVAGATYTATAWVKAASASSVGKPIQIKLRERTTSGTVVADVGSANVLLTNAWQQLTVTRTTAAGNQLGVRLSHGSAVTGNAFFADAFALSTGAAPPPPPNQAPTAAFTVAPAAPQTGQQATFTDTSTDTDGTIAARAWDLDNDGAFDDGTGATAARSFAAAGTYTVRLQVTDDDGAPATATRQVVVRGPAAPPNQAPTAAFTVAPAAPQTGQQATFTDTSTDTDGTIAARAWDLDNDGAFDDGTGATAARSFAGGRHLHRAPAGDRRRRRAGDHLGPGDGRRRASAAAAPAPPGNLVANPSFETSTVGWSGYQGTLVREAQAGAPNGGYVARVTRSSGTYFTIDGGNNVSPTVAGTTYTATAWVKAASASSVGKPIQIKLRERTTSGTVVADVGSANVLLTNAWQQLTVTRTTAAGNQLGVRLSHGSAVTGNAFFADAFTLVRG